MNKDVKGADFETAIAACQFGLFNITVLIVTLVLITGTLFETTTMSFVVPVADCELELTLMFKGLLNGITFTGMIASAVAWGYLGDMLLGRKQSIVVGVLLEGLFVLGSACSQNEMQLLIWKFLGGAIASGPFAVLMSYISEVHSKKYRAIAMMAPGICVQIACLIIPILAWAILPLNINFNVSYLKFHSWQVFLATTAFPSLLSGLIFIFLPESPKYLMSQGRNEEALDVFKTIYSWNTLKPKDTYEISSLSEEIPQHSPTDAHVSFATSIHTEAIQVESLFKKPYLRLSMLVYTIHFSVLLSYTLIRLWLPQIFASISPLQSSNTDITMCNIIDYNLNRSSIAEHAFENNLCVVEVTNESYINNIIAAIAGLAGALTALCLVPLFGNKVILCSAMSISFALSVVFYFVKGEVYFLMVASLFMAFISIVVSTSIGASINLFPTHVRTMVVIMIHSFGRIGAFIGSISLPVLMTMNCAYPFFELGLVLFSGAVATLYLPETTRMELK